MRNGLVLVALATFAVVGTPATRGSAVRPVAAASTLVDATGLDSVTAVALAADGSAWVVGSTWATDFPVTPDALQPEPGGGGEDAFLARVSRDGSTLLYATYFGGSAGDRATGVALAADGSVVVCGTTSSRDLPTEGGFQTAAPGGLLDGWVARFEDGGRRLAYATYVGGSGQDELAALTLAPDGRVVVAGTTLSADVATSAGAFQPAPPPAASRGIAFLAEIDPSASGPASLVYATYLGGTAAAGGEGPTRANDVAVDAAGRAVVCGATGSRSWPTTAGAVKRDGPIRRRTDGFVTVVDPAASGAAGLVYSTYLGGLIDEVCEAVAVAPDGSLLVAGSTTSADFPTTPGAFRTSPPSAGDVVEEAFVARLDLSGGLVYATYLGGMYLDWATGVAIDAAGRTVVVGWTSSPDFPLARPVEAPEDGRTAFVTRLSPAGDALDFSTVFGGDDADGDAATAVATDGPESLVVAMNTSSRAFPTTPTAFRRVLGGAKIESAGAVVRFETRAASCRMDAPDVAATADMVRGDETGAIVTYPPPGGCATVDLLPASGSYFASGRTRAVALALEGGAITSVSPYDVDVAVPYDTCLRTVTGYAIRLVTTPGSPVLGAWEYTDENLGELAAGVAEMVRTEAGRFVLFTEATSQELQFQAKLKTPSRKLIVRSLDGRVLFRGQAGDCAAP
jgi:hypothetical protein